MGESAPSKAALLAAINSQWGALTTALDQLDPAQLTTLRDAQGWSVKDHLVHLSAWERSALFFLQGKPRAEGLRVDPALWTPGNFEAINTAIQAQTRDMPLDDAMAQLYEVHHELLDTLQPLSDADLAKPYGAFQPDEQDAEETRLAYQVVEDNTVDHYAEHLHWIQSLAQQESKG